MYLAVLQHIPCAQTVLRNDHRDLITLINIPQQILHTCWINGPIPVICIRIWILHVLIEVRHYLIGSHGSLASAQIALCLSQFILIRIRETDTLTCIIVHSQKIQLPFAYNIHITRFHHRGHPVFLQIPKRTCRVFSLKINIQEEMVF